VLIWLVFIALWVAVFVFGWLANREWDRVGGWRD
jgi:hypothetical protein